MPLQRRVPKFGFTNPNRVEYKGINLDTLQALVDKTGLKAIAPADLVANGLAGKHDLVKILGRGELSAGVEVSAHQFSKSATAAIEGAGGKCSTIDRHAK
jgi:large subunit ribosomal protein L15